MNRCCDPRTDWCTRPAMEDAIQHANERARVSTFRQAVYRSMTHERYTNGRQFWIISTFHRDLTLAGAVRRPKVTA